MGGLGPMIVKVSWLGELESVFWLVEMDFFSLECKEVPCCEFFWCLWVWHGWEAHLLMLSVVFLFCWRISMACPAMEFVGSSVELGFSEKWRLLCELLSISVSWTQELSYVLTFWS